MGNDFKETSVNKIDINKFSENILQIKWKFSELSAEAQENAINSYIADDIRSEKTEYNDAYSILLKDLTEDRYDINGNRIDEEEI